MGLDVVFFCIGLVMLYQFLTLADDAQVLHRYAPQRGHSAALLSGVSRLPDPKSMRAELSGEIKWGQRKSEKLFGPFGQAFR